MCVRALGKLPSPTLLAGTPRLNKETPTFNFVEARLPPPPIRRRMRSQWRPDYCREFSRTSPDQYAVADFGMTSSVSLAGAPSVTSVQDRDFVFGDHRVSPTDESCAEREDTPADHGSGG